MPGVGRIVPRVNAHAASSPEGARRGIDDCLTCVTVTAFIYAPLVLLVGFGAAIGIA